MESIKKSNVRTMCASVFSLNSPWPALIILQLLQVGTHLLAVQVRTFFPPDTMTAIFGQTVQFCSYYSRSCPLHSGAKRSLTFATSATSQVTMTQESAHCGHTVNPPIILRQLHSIICPWIDLFSPDRCTFLSRTWKTFAEHSDRCEWTCSAVCGATSH